MCLEGSFRRSSSGRLVLGTEHLLSSGFAQKQGGGRAAAAVSGRGASVLSLFQRTEEKNMRKTV